MIGGEYTFNIFNDGKDVGFYLCADKINDLCCAQVTRESFFDSILGCQDKKVRILHESSVVMEATVDGGVTEIHVGTIYVYMRIYLCISRDDLCLYCCYTCMFI